MHEYPVLQAASYVVYAFCALCAVAVVFFLLQDVKESVNKDDDVGPHGL